ncbi:hypothetical protein U1Q18_028329 [Sarracenia purpurea var. burkii]
MKNHQSIVRAHRQRQARAYSTIASSGPHRQESRVVCRCGGGDPSDQIRAWFCPRVCEESVGDQLIVRIFCEESVGDQLIVRIF